MAFWTDYPTSSYNAADLAILINKINQESRHIKHLVNSAGIFAPKPFLDHTTEDFDDHHNINKALFQITQYIARNMQQHSAGTIVNIGSMYPSLH